MFEDNSSTLESWKIEEKSGIMKTKDCETDPNNSTCCTLCTINTASELESPIPCREEGDGCSVEEITVPHTYEYVQNIDSREYVTRYAPASDELNYRTKRSYRGSGRRVAKPRKSKPHFRVYKGRIIT